MPDDPKPQDLEFLKSFKEYLTWVAKGSPLEGESRRPAMLDSFQKFLGANGIDTAKAVHFELLAKMTDFAKGSGTGGPR